MSRLVRYAPKAARFLLATPSDQLPKSRAAVFSAPLSAADGGDGGSLTLGVDPATAEARGVLRLAGQLGGQADAPDVRGLRVADGAQPVETYTLLTVGIVRDGELLVRIGGALVSVPVPAVAGSQDLDMGGHKIANLAAGTASSDAATYGQLQSMVNGLDWQASVLDRDQTSPPSNPTPQVGDRHLVASPAGAAWAGHDLEIATFDGAQWSFTAPNPGMTVHVEADGVDYWYDGAAWVSLGTSVDHNSLLNLGTGNPHPQYQQASEKGQSGGYAALDGEGALAQPAARLRAVTGDPASPVPGELWVDGKLLRYRDDDQVTGPNSKTVVTSGRTVATAGGLVGGGDLSANRTLSIAAFSGVVSKDADPPSQEYAPLSTTNVLVLDVGTEGQLLPVALRLPDPTDARLNTAVEFEFSDASTVTFAHTGTGSDLDRNMQQLLDLVTGGLSGPAARNGLRLQKIRLQVKNVHASDAVTADVGTFKVRAIATPRGAGAAL